MSQRIPGRWWRRADDFNCRLYAKHYYHKIASLGDFKGLHLVVYVALRSWRSVVPGAGPITNVTTARVIKTNPTTPVVELMVEKIPFSAPFAADVTQRWIRDLARYREPRHCRSIFEIAVTLMPFAALWALAWAAVHFGYWELSFLLAMPAAGFLVRLLT